MTVADNLNVDATELATLTADGHAIAADCARLGIAGNVPSSLDPLGAASPLAVAADELEIKVTPHGGRPARRDWV